MAKQSKRKIISQPLRQSHRARILNTRLGTPPKIVQDMLKDHSSSITKRRLFAADVANIENAPQKTVATVTLKSTKKMAKQNTKSLKNTIRTSGVRPRRQHIPNKRYTSPFDELPEAKRPLKSVSNVVLKKEKIAVASESKKAKTVVSSTKKPRMRTSSEASVSSTKIRHSSRHRVPNPRFDFIVPGFLHTERTKAVDNMKATNKRKEATTANVFSPARKEKEVITTHISKATANKSLPLARRHSQRQRIPSKRLTFPDSLPITPKHKKFSKARSGRNEKPQAEVRKYRNLKRKSTNASKMRMTATPRGLSLASVTDSNRQIHSSSEVPSVLYPYKPAKSAALCVHASSSSLTKDYTSKKDIEDLLEEIDFAFAVPSNGGNLEVIRQKITHQLNSLHRENCRFRQTLRQLRAEVDSLSNNSTVNRCNMLMKQNGELREQKVLADIRCEAQAEELRKMTERIRILEMQNKSLEENRAELLEQKRQQQKRQLHPHLNGVIEAVHNGKEEDLTGSEMDYGANCEDTVLLNGNDSEDRNDEIHNDEIVWGNDAWMLHC